MKTKPLIVTAAASLAVLLAALFVPLLGGMGWIFVITLSVWESSRLFALLCIAAMAAITLTPVVRPSRKAWVFPFLLGAAIFASVLCAVPYALGVSRDLSNGFFCPGGLLVLALGGLLCVAEGFVARSQLRPIPNA